MYYDALNGEYVSLETLKSEFNYLVATNQVDTTNFNLYIIELLRSRNLEIVKNYSSI